ncbi:MAG: sulfite exporter TauE/SafE family protein [Prochlorococcaceae cyanobacterium]
MVDHSGPMLLALALVAFFYASVGHAGASGYIAVFSLFGVEASAIKPLALLLNVAVAALGTWQFLWAGHLRLGRIWPVYLLAIPSAFLGGYLDLPIRWFNGLVGLVLLTSAAWFVQQPRDPERLRDPRPSTLLLTGSSLGLLAGLTGTGGGVFLTPLLVLMGWCRTREAAAVSVLFILLNSLAALGGLLLTRQTMPPLPWPLFLTVALAGGLGSRLGSAHWPVATIRRTLAAVVAVAGMRLLLSD